MRIRVVDFETSRADDTAKVCEVGYCDLLRLEDGAFQIGNPVSWLCDPGHEISPEAMGIHHITNKMIEDALAPSFDPATLHSDAIMNGAHNVSFEQQYFDGQDKPWACSYKVALRLWPEAPNHKLQTLRYWLDLDSEPDFNPELAVPPHRAAADAYVGAFVLRRQFMAVGGKQVAQWTREPHVLPRVGFGKHKGMRWHEVPDDYIEWLVTKATDLREDVLDTARHHAYERGII